MIHPLVLFSCTNDQLITRGNNISSHGEVISIDHGAASCVRGPSDDLTDNYYNYQLTADLCSIFHLAVTG